MAFNLLQMTKFYYFYLLNKGHIYKIPVNKLANKMTKTPKNEIEMTRTNIKSFQTH